MATAGVISDTSTEGRTVTGSAGSKFLSGLNGNDLINGGAGVDLLHDGANSDTFAGCSGADILVLAYDYNSCIITDFENSANTIDPSSWPWLRSISLIDHDNVPDRFAYLLQERSLHRGLCLLLTHRPRTFQQNLPDRWDAYSASNLAKL